MVSHLTTTLPDGLGMRSKQKKSKISPSISYRKTSIFPSGTSFVSSGIGAKSVVGEIPVGMSNEVVGGEVGEGEFVGDIKIDGENVGVIGGRLLRIEPSTNESGTGAGVSSGIGAISVVGREVRDKIGEGVGKGDSVGDTEPGADPLFKKIAAPPPITPPHTTTTPITAIAPFPVLPAAVIAASCAPAAFVSTFASF